MSEKIYNMMTDLIIKKIEKGVIPWQVSWKSSQFLPQRLVRINKDDSIITRPYHGINVFWLACQEYSSPYWVSWKQCSELGEYVLKGEAKRYCPVIFWKINKKKKVDTDQDGDETSGSYAMIRYYRVYNIEQTSLVLPEKPTVIEEREVTSIELADDIIANYPEKKPKMGIGAPSYNPVMDMIRMPEQKNFTSDSKYYSTMFHEMVHSTGHEKRINRNMHGMAMAEKASYAKEEMIAEMGATFLSADCEFATKTIDNSAAYIAGWLKALRNDKKMIVQAGSAAHKAVNFIKGIKAEGE